ncbi:protein rep [Phormidium sp. FACHB-1136]|uniref:protein rep n=1 Tax=Phormidium sp. FACHB-1136 TaxID=2692848 RepID=UPI00322093FB
MTGMNRAVSPVYLSDISERDKPWDIHRAQAEAVEALYGVLGYQRYQERMGACSGRLQFALISDGDDGVVPHLQSAFFCRVRTCPVCQWRRALMWRARFYKAIPEYLNEHHGRRPVFLTLTVRNCAISELRQTVDQMNTAFKRMSQRKNWPGVAWVKSLEVTRGADGSAHPHFHVLMFVKPGYFQGKNYIKQAAWRELWRSCLRVDYLPVVNVKTVKSKTPTGDTLADIRVAILETLKYGVKPDDLTHDAEWLGELTRQLHKTRAVAVGGELRPYLREDEPEDLVHDEDLESEMAATEDDPRLVFDWMTTVKRYAQKLAN